MNNKTLLEQHNISWLGTFINVLYLTTPLIGIVGYAMMATTMYATVVIPYIKPVLPWFDFWVYCIFAFLGCCFMLFMVWLIVHQSYYDNPIKKAVKRNTEILQKIMKQMGIEDIDSDRD